MTENELKQAVLRLAYAAGWMVFHMTATPIRGSQGRGYPDLTMARPGDRPTFIELKQEAGILSKDQMQWMRVLGTAYHVIRPSDLESGAVADLLR